MTRLARIGVTLAALLAVSAHADDAVYRLKREQAELREQLLKRCPAQRDAVAQLETTPPAARVELYRKLDACGGSLEAFLVQFGATLNFTEHFAEAEAVFRRALKLRVTESSQLGLLTALTRQPSLSAAQKADVSSNLDYFRQHTCSRDDLCAALCYVAWHADDVELTKRAGERAIELKFPGWQPYFFAGTVYATGSAADRRRAVELLQEARTRGGPAKAIDGFLTDLGITPRTAPDAGR